MKSFLYSNIFVVCMVKRGKKESLLSIFGLSSKPRKHKKSVRRSVKSIGRSVESRVLPSKGVNVRPAFDALRDLKNWVFVFAEEYDLPEEAVSMLHKKIDDVAEKLR